MGIEFKQIILVTDGESNAGIDPVLVAKGTGEQSITVNTIGITDMQREESMTEIREIAESSGGVWEHTDISNLDAAMSMVSMKSVYNTLEETVSKELKSLVGSDLEELHPGSRKKIIDLIDKLGDEADIKCCLVIDCSGSMKRKIDIAKSSALNLLRVLNSRKGKTEIAVLGYPHSEEEYSILCEFTDNIINLEKGLQKIKIGGRTPTGMALKGAISILQGDVASEKEIALDDFEGGLLASNVI